MYIILVNNHVVLKITEKLSMKVGLLPSHIKPKCGCHSVSFKTTVWVRAVSFPQYRERVQNSPYIKYCVLENSQKLLEMLLSYSTIQKCLQRERKACRSVMSVLPWDAQSQRNSSVRNFLFPQLPQVGSAGHCEYQINNIIVICVLLLRNII